MAFGRREIRLICVKHLDTVSVWDKVSGKEAKDYGYATRSIRSVRWMRAETAQRAVPTTNSVKIRSQKAGAFDCFQLRAGLTFGHTNKP
jgi:hypothetical protein